VIDINGLIDANVEDVVVRADEMQQAGCRCIKMKVAGLSVHEVVEAVRRLRRVGPDLEIRLDANRAWSFDLASEILSTVEDLAVSYVEEPLDDPSNLDRLAHSVSVPIALDESLIDIEPERLSDFGYASAVILKPTILGGIERTREYARRASLNGMRSVISATFESGVGVLWLVALASCPEFDETAGLDTYRSFENDVFDPALRFAYRFDTSLTRRLYDLGSDHAG
jgi:O-succinylbenzoate synthase